MESPVESWRVPLPPALAAGFEAARAAFGVGNAVSPAHGPQQLPAPQEKHQRFWLEELARSSCSVALAGEQCRELLIFILRFSSAVTTIERNNLQVGKQEKRKYRSTTYFPL